MIFAPKILLKHGHYNFYPKQLYLLETEQAELAIRAEWFSGSAKITDYEVVGTEPVANVISALNNKARNISWAVHLVNGNLTFKFKKPTNDKLPTYKGRFVFKYYGVLPVSIHSFTAQVSSIASFLKDTETNVHKLENIRQAM